MNSISEDVLVVLRTNRFFERLDDLFCPIEPNSVRARCGNSFALSSGILREFGMDSDEVDDALAVLRSKGACCDCEVLYNVAEESRLRAEYWKERQAKIIRNNPQVNASIH